ncbi:hypothetical protein ABZ461_17035 [Actinacidiphila glaucinigra]|uniref:hypothetical protein n=1 Tax=Actinacidiphila glaucinigra TaxID=235986 RepID=UPI0033FB1F05
MTTSEAHRALDRHVREFFSGHPVGTATHAWATDAAARYPTCVSSRWARVPAATTGPM